MTPYLIPHIPRHRCAHVYDICGEATDYERALRYTFGRASEHTAHGPGPCPHRPLLLPPYRYNINEVERSSLVEMLALLKGVHAALARAQGDPEVRLRRAIGSRLGHAPNPTPHAPYPDIPTTGAHPPRDP